MNNDNIDVSKLRKGDHWHGIYKGISWKICRWDRPNDTGMQPEVWNYYIYINLSKVNPADAKAIWLRAKTSKFLSGRKLYNYPGETALADIDMQGGITWYSKQYSLNDEKVVMIGCDYDHIWNDRQYSLWEIVHDLEQSIESVRERLPELKELK